MKREAFRVVLGAALAVCLIAVPPATAAKAATLPTAYAPQLTRYPYLTDVAGGGATINWATDRSSASAYVTWGVAGVESCTAHSSSATRTQITVGSTPEYQWKARLSLAPNTTYCYRVYLGATGSGLDLLGSNPSPQFATQLPAGSTTPFKFAVLGDWGSATASGNPDQANLMGQLASSGARFALSTGDIAYPGGSQTNYGDLYQTGANVSAVFGPQFWTVPGASMPLFPVLGNHGLNATFPLIWPGASAAASSAGRFQIDNYCCLNGTASANYPSAWYAFDAGPARFYVLDAAWANSNLGTGSLYENDFDYHWTPASPEYQWLEHDLATHSAQVKFATFHFPLYSANATETSDAFLHGPDSLEGLLSRYGVDIAFNGHAHIYERNNANGPGGLISYVTGGGGATLEPVSKCSGLAGIVAYAIGWSNSSATGSACGSASRPVSSSQVFHFLLVSVDGNTVTVTPTDSLGRTLRQPDLRISTRQSAARHHASDRAGESRCHGCQLGSRRPVLVTGDRQRGRHRIPGLPRRSAADHHACVSNLLFGYVRRGGHDLPVHGSRGRRGRERVEPQPRRLRDDPQRRLCRGVVRSGRDRHRRQRNEFRCAAHLDRGGHAGRHDRRAGRDNQLGEVRYRFGRQHLEQGAHRLPVGLQHPGGDLVQLRRGAGDPRHRHALGS